MASGFLKRALIEFDARTAGLRAGVAEGVATLKGFSDQVEREGKRIDRAWGAAASSIGRSLLRISAVGAVGLGGAVKYSTDFESAMRNVNSIAKETEANFAQTSKTVQGLGPALRINQGPQQLAEALYDINSAGFKASDGVKVLAVSGRAASAGLTDAKTAADGITTGLNAFGKSADFAGQFGDVLFKTVELGKTTFGELAPNIGKVATIASNAGVSFEEMNAGLALLTARGLSTEEATVALRGVILKLLDPSKESAKLFEQLGIQTGEAAIKSKGLAGILQEIQTKTGGNKTQISALLGDVRAFNGALGLIGDDGGRKFVETIGQMEQASGSLDSALNQQQKSIKFQAQALAATAQAAAISFGNALAPAIGEAVQVAQGLLDKFNQLPETTQRNIALVAAMATAGAALAGTMLTLAPGIAAVGTALAGAEVGLISMLGPIGLVVAGAGAVGYAFAHDIGGIRGIVDQATRSAGRAFKTMASDVKSSLVQMKSDVDETFGEVVDVIRDAWTLLGPLVKEAAEGLRTNLSLLTGFLRAEFAVAWEIASGTVSVVWTSIRDYIHVGVVATKATLEVLTAFLAGDWRLALVKMEEGVKHTLGAVRQLFADQLKAILDLLENVGSEFVSQGERLVDDLVAGVRSRLSGVKSAFAEVRRTAQDELEPLGPVAEKKIGEAFDLVLERAQVFRDQFRQVMSETFQPVLDATGIENLVSGVSSKLKNNPLSSFVSRLRQRVSAAGQQPGAQAPTPTATSPASTDAKKTKGFSRADAIDYIRKNAAASSNLSGLSGLDDRTLAAMEKTLKNAVSEGIGLVITSSYDPNRANKGSHHRTGQAVDVVPVGQGVTNANSAAVLSALADGSGFSALIDEFRQSVRDVTGGTGPHGHLTTGAQRQFQGTDNRDAVLFPSGGGALAELEKKASEEAAKAHEEAQKKREEAQKHAWEFIRQGESDLQRDLRALAEGYAEIEKNAKLLDPEQLEAAKDAYERGIADIMTRQRALFDEQKQQLAELNTAASGADDIGPALVEKQQFEEYAQARIQKRLEIYDLEIQLGLATLEQKAQWLQQETLNEDLTYEHKLQLRQTLHETELALEQERAATSQAITSQLQSGLQQFLSSTLTGQQQFGKAFESLWKGIMNTVISKIAEAIVKTLVLKKILGGIFGGLGIFHAGGEVGVDAGESLGSALAGLPSFHSGGLVGVGPGSLGADEVLAKLQVGEVVLPRKAVAALRRSSSQPDRPVSIEIGAVHNYGPESTEALSADLAWQLRAKMVGA